MVRLLVEDVTLRRGERTITVHVRFRGGPARSLDLPVPLCSWQLRKTPDEIVTEIDRLLDDHTDEEVARILGEQEMLSGKGRPMSIRIVGKIRDAYGLKSRYQRLRDAGLLTQDEISQRLRINPATTRKWRSAGMLRAQPFNSKGGFLYDPPGPDAPRPQRGRALGNRALPVENALHLPDEVQCEA